MPTILNPHQWTRLGKDQLILNFELRKNIVFSQSLILTLAGLVVHLIGDAWRGDYWLVLFILISIVVTAGCYYLNEQHHHRAGKIVFFTSFNIIFFIVAALVPRECAVSFLFLPLIVLALVVHATEDFKTSILFALFSLMSLLVLEINDYTIFGSFKILEQSSLFNSVINILSASVILTISLVFLIQHNQLAEQKLLQREDQLKKTNNKLDKILYHASHDLRAPLNSIRGLANLAAMESDQQSISQYFKMIDDRATKLDHFIIDVLEFSRNDKVEIHITSVSIRELVNEIAESLRYMDGAAKIRLIQDFGDVDLINTDRKKLTLILSNLLSNSIKYHNHQNTDPWIKISVEPNMSEILVHVADNGSGIPAQHQHKIFDMFYRAHESSVGSGLGLFIVKETIAQLSGEITLHSIHGKGSSFTVALPKLANA